MPARCQDNESNFTKESALPKCPAVQIKIEWSTGSVYCQMRDVHECSRLHYVTRIITSSKREASRASYECFTTSVDLRFGYQTLL